jgi:hypothetical protein
MPTYLLTKLLTRLLTGPASALILLSGCAATTMIDEYRPSNQPIAISANEKVALLGRRDAGHYETDREFITCIANKIKGGQVDVIEEQDFIDAIYPWFEPRTAPKGLARLQRLLQQPFIKAEIDRQGVRYLIWLDGSTETKGNAGSISCAVGPAGGGCFGFAKWDKVSVYEAVVWDLQLLEEKGRLRVDSEGSSYLIGAVAPIPLLTPVKSDACSSLGKQLKSFFLAQ